MFSTYKTLQNRIRELELLNETLLGKNYILERELDKAQNDALEFRMKLFEVIGLGPMKPLAPEIQGPKIQRDPIQVGNRKTPSWPQVRETLEVQARREYWEKKNKKPEDKNLEGELDKLEKEVFNNAG